MARNRAPNGGPYIVAHIKGGERVEQEFHLWAHAARRLRQLLVAGESCITVKFA